MALNNDMRLQFRMGSKSGLDAIITRTPGTVYVTTDEQAMYVDINAEKRIRISDIIQINSVKDLGEPPYSTDGFYYFIQDNALMKCLGEDGKGGWNWVQLNSVSDVTANLNEVESRVSTLETSVGTLNTTVTKLNGEASVPGSVAEAKAAADAAQEDATEALNKIGVPTAEGQTASGLYAKVETAQATANTNATDISNLESRVEDTESAIATLASTDNTKDGSVAKAQKTADDAAAAASAADTKAGNAATAAANAQTTANEAKSAAGTNATAISGLDGRLSTAEGKVTTLTTDLGNLTARVTEAEGDIDDLEAYATTLKGADTVDGSVANAKKAGTDAQATADKNTEDIEAIDGRVTTVEGTVTTLANTTVPNLTNRVKANEDNIKALQDNLGASDDTKTENTAFGRIAALEESLGGSSEAGSVIERLDEVEDAVEVQNGLIEGLTTSVGNNADAISNISGILGDKQDGQTGTIFELIADNASAITDNASDIKDLQDIVGDDTKGLVKQVEENKTGLANLKSTVDAIPNTYVSQETYDDDKEQLAKDMEAQHKIITDSIKAANGMTYKGIIENSLDELPVPGEKEVRIGDTYVVANDEGLIADTVYYSGDMLIARGDEDPETGLLINNDNFGWDHVKTGYELNHDPKMDVVAASITENEETVSVAKINLHRFYEDENANSLGEFTIKGGENVKVSVDTETKVVTIGMAWDTF